MFSSRPFYWGEGDTELTTRVASQEMVPYGTTGGPRPRLVRYRKRALSPPQVDGNAATTPSFTPWQETSCAPPGIPLK